MRLGVRAAVVASLGPLALASHCASFSGSDAPSLDAGTEDASGDERVPVTGVPEGCDATADPKDSPKCVDDGFGVFVDAATGSDTNLGTKSSPVKTIGGALGKLGGKTRVYLASGTYPEHVTLTTATSLYGGFASGSWTYDGTKAAVAPTDAGYALAVKGVSDALVLADVSFTAQPGTASSPASIAGFLANASVTFRRAPLTAGKGADGADGVAPGDFATAAPPGTGGAAGGAATPNTDCPTSIGGAGGKDGAPKGGNGVVAVAPVYPALASGAGSVDASCTGSGVGSGAFDGSYGIAGNPGAGAPSLGTLTVDGWQGADGTPGGKGGDGQGGGGGALRSAGVGGVGGSGGPGGCGGRGGPQGTAGGSSIALVVFQSKVSLASSPLAAGGAGRGGSGAKGQKGQLVATLTGQANNGAFACSGGLGGIGGSGGGGGGGAGGVSAGILYTGTAPVIDGASTASSDQLAGVTVGAPGAAGSKGAGGDAAQTSAPMSRAGVDGSDGAGGQSKAVLLAP